MKKLSLWGRVRRLRYPATPEGRKAYVRDSLNKPTLRRDLITYIVLLIISLTGLAILLDWIINASYISSMAMLILYCLASVLMIGALTGFIGILDTRRK